MGERIKELRKKLGLTQQEFADKLGIKRGAVANYEIGRNVPIDAVISLICREFNVNEDWLRNGTGPMITALSREEEIAAWVQRALGTTRSEEFKQRLIFALSALNEEQWELLEQKMLEIVGDRPIPEAPPDYEAEARAEAEEYYQEVILEKKRAEESSASENSGGGTKLA